MLPSITPCVAGRSQFCYHNRIAAQSPPAILWSLPRKRCHTEALPTVRHDSEPSSQKQSTKKGFASQSAIILQQHYHYAILRWIHRNPPTPPGTSERQFSQQIQQIRTNRRFFASSNKYKTKKPIKIRVIAHNCELHDTLNLL